jgi:hypothetical protein
MTVSALYQRSVRPITNVYQGVGHHPPLCKSVNIRFAYNSNPTAPTVLSILPALEISLEPALKPSGSDFR